MVHFRVSYNGLRNERDIICSCPPFECTCGQWTKQISPRVASSPPCSTKRLNLRAPGIFDFPSASRMRSLSIEIGTNQYPNSRFRPEPPFYTEPPYSVNTSMDMYDDSNFLPAMRGPFETPSCQRSTGEMCPFNTMPLACGDVGSEMQTRPFNFEDTRYRNYNLSYDSSESSFLFSNETTRSSNDLVFKKVKHETKSSTDTCAIMNTDSRESNDSPALAESSTRDLGSREFGSFGTSELYNDLDCYSNLFDTDIYSSFISRIGDQPMLEKEQASYSAPPNSTMIHLAELKPIRQQDSRHRLDQEVLLPSAPRTVDSIISRPHDYMYNCPDSSAFLGQIPNNIFAQTSFQEVTNTQTRNTEYDGRYRYCHDSHQQGSSTQKPYCNHSINITLTYK
ncbi:hypothetical protein CHS0354_016445 [Potamilus streckersoni]|uniref:Uncharacterized protein n=1 Tax=Potamilus streckersoni TaxID=2493646 RepID=A0AAE0TL01_9BIVA|nr:hypothetical protein CHS0354_016445 [Potamilus streckersoni]